MYGGDVDFEPVSKAVGKVPSILFFISVAFAAGVFLFLDAALPRGIRPLVRLKPPRKRLRFLLLPPSHAPPVTAFAR